MYPEDCEIIDWPKCKPPKRKLREIDLYERGFGHKGFSEWNQRKEQLRCEKELNRKCPWYFRYNAR